MPKISEKCFKNQKQKIQIPTFEYINELWYLALNLSIKLEL